MKRVYCWTAAGVVVAVLAAAPAWARSASAGRAGSRSPAAWKVSRIRVADGAGPGGLNAGGSAQVTSVSCASAGNCSAGGSYTDGGHHEQAFVVSQKNGTWGPARRVPGTAALNTGGSAQVTSVSCASAGNCSAGGTYQQTLPNGIRGFVAGEVHGRWSAAIEVPGTAASPPFTPVDSMSCGSAGNCSAGGSFVDSSGNTEAFVVNEVHGSWGKDFQVRGTSSLDTSIYTGVYSVSCTSAGNCSAAGSNSGGNSSDGYMFVVSEKNGTWGRAKIFSIGFFPGEMFSVSCASAGNCSAGGNYGQADGQTQIAVINQKHGTWGKASELAGAPTAPNLEAHITISCASAGNCSAGGWYDLARPFHHQAFVVSEKNGTWRTARKVPGL